MNLSQLRSRRFVHLTGGPDWEVEFEIITFSFFFFNYVFMKITCLQALTRHYYVIGGGGEIFKKFLFRDDISLFVYEMKMEAGKKKGKLGSYSFRRCLNI